MYLRVGLLGTQGWRTFKLRQDFSPAAKVQTEDDITASIVVPAGRLGMRPRRRRPPATNSRSTASAGCSSGPTTRSTAASTSQTEADMARPDNFLSNFEPLTSDQARAQVERVTEFDEFTAPMQQLLRAAAEAGNGHVVSSAYPRLIDGKPIRTRATSRPGPTCSTRRPAISPSAACAWLA